MSRHLSKNKNIVVLNTLVFGAINLIFFFFSIFHMAREDKLVLGITFQYDQADLVGVSYKKKE